MYVLWVWLVSLSFVVQGMVDPGEVVSTTVKREFIEEAMNLLALSEDDRNRTYQQIGDFFKNYTQVNYMPQKLTRILF